jgi:hypothetical protein
MTQADQTDYCRAVRVAGRAFKLAPLSEEQLYSLFVNPESSLRVWDQYWHAIYCSMANAGMTPPDMNLEGLTVVDVHQLLHVIGELHCGIPSCDLMDSRTLLSIVETNPHIH